MLGSLTIILCLFIFKEFDSRSMGVCSLVSVRVGEWHLGPVSLTRINVERIKIYPIRPCVPTETLKKDIFENVSRIGPPALTSPPRVSSHARTSNC